MNSAYRLIAVLQIITVTLLIAITLLVFFPLQRELSEQVLNLKNELIDVLEQSLGNNIRFSSIHPSIFSYIELRNLRLYDDEDQTLLTIDRLIFRYDIRAVLRGQPLAAPRLVELRGGVMYLHQLISPAGDSQRPSDPWELLSELSTELRILLRNYRIEYRDPAGQWLARSLVPRGELSYSGDSLAVQIENISELIFEDEALNPPFREISGSSDIQGELLIGQTGSFSDVFESSVFQLYISTSTLRSDRFVLSPLDFYLSLDSDRLLFRSLEGRQPFVLELEYRSALQETRLRFSAAEWSPSAILRLEQAGSDYNRLLNSLISAGLELSFDNQFRPLRGEGWLDSSGWLPVLDQSARVQAQFALSDSVLTVEQLEMRSDRGDLLSVNGEYHLDQNDLSVRGMAVNRSIAAIPQFDISGSGTYRNDTIEINLQGPSISSLSLADSQILVNLKESGGTALVRTGLPDEAGQVNLEADFTGDLPSIPENLRISARIEEMQLRSAIQAFAVLSGNDFSNLDLPEDLNASAINGSFTAEISDLPNDPAFQIQASGLTLGGAGQEILAVSGGFKDSVLQIPNLSINYLGQSLRFGVSGDFSRRGQVPLEIRSEINGFPYSAQAVLYPQRGEFTLKGDYDSAATLRGGNDGGKLQASIRGLPIQDLGEDARVAANMSADLRYDDILSSRIAIRSTVDELDIFPLEGQRRSSARIDAEGSIADGIIITNAEYRDFISSVAGNGALSIESGIVQASLRLENQLERVVFEGSSEQGDLDVRITLRRFPARRMGNPDLVGLINGNVIVRGRPQEPAIDFSLNTEDARFQNDQIIITARGGYESDVLRVENALIELSSIALREVQGSVGLGDGQVQVQGDVFLADTSGAKNPVQALFSSVSLPALPQALQTDIGRDLRLADFWTNASGNIRLQALGGQQDSRWQLALSERDGNLVINGGPNYAPESVSGTLFADGSFTSSFLAPLPVRFTADGFLEGANIDLNLAAVSMDLDRLFSSTGMSSQDEYVAFLGGQGSGGLRVTGSIVDPDFYGTLMVRDLQVYVEIIPEILESQTAFVILEGKEFFIPETMVSAGPDGSARLSGSLSMDRWLPDTLVLQVSTGDAAIPVESDFDSVVVDGFARGNVEIGVGFTQSALWVTGDLEATATGITLSSSLAEERAAEDEFDTLVDLNVVSGRGVEFFWPTRNFPILRTAALPGDSINIRYLTSPESLALTGNIAIRGGEIFYFEQNFYINNGNMRFNESLESFDPQLSINAEVLSSDENGPVRIYLDIEEDRLSQLQPRFTSVPSKQEPEIIALLGGQIIGGGGGDQIEIVDAVISGSEIIGQIGLFRDIQTEIKERLALDLFSIRTGLFQNFLQDVIVTPDPDFPLNSNSPITLGRYLQNTTLLMGRYIGDEVFMELMVQLQEQNPVDRASDDFVGIEIDAELSLDWVTPFFNLTWSFAPENPETLFVTDHTLTFTRDFSPGSQ